MAPDEEEEISPEARAQALALMKRFGVLDRDKIEAERESSDEIVSAKKGAATKIPKGTVKGVGRRTRVKK